MPEMPLLEVPDTYRSADHVTRHGHWQKPEMPLYLSDYGQKVLLDSDLAHLYSVATSSLKEQVKRTINRFPDDLGLGSRLKSWIL